jgi:DNA-binding response OmpR family regulator
MNEIDIEVYKRYIFRIRKYTSNLSVLIAEDYQPLFDELNKLFKSIFKTVEATTDGQEALEMYKKNISSGECYSIIFTDIKMPNMNGIELIKEIKKINPNENIVVFSAHQDSNYLLELINLGVRRFILKPASILTLLEELALLCDEIYNKQTTNILTLSDNVTYDKELKSLYLDGNLIVLTKYEQLFIELFIEKVNLAVSNDDIVNHLYLNMIDMNVDNVRKLMYKLRQKLPKNFIKSIHGIGYRVIMENNDKLTT